jgi:hypothetical protein
MTGLNLILVSLDTVDCKDSCKSNVPKPTKITFSLCIFLGVLKYQISEEKLMNKKREYILVFWDVKIVFLP